MAKPPTLLLAKSVFVPMVLTSEELAIVIVCMDGVAGLPVPEGGEEAYKSFLALGRKLVRLNNEAVQRVIDEAATPSAGSKYVN